MKSIITTQGVTPASRSRHWHQAIAETYFPLDIQFAESDRFNVRADVAGNVDYVKWIINGKSHIVYGYLWDYEPPYEIMAGHLTYWDLAPGYYDVKAIAYQAVGREDTATRQKDGKPGNGIGQFRPPLDRAVVKRQLAPFHTALDTRREQNTDGIKNVPGRTESCPGIHGYGAAHGAGNADRPFQSGQTAGDALARQRREIGTGIDDAQHIGADIPETGLFGSIQNHQSADPLVRQKNVGTAAQHGVGHAIGVGQLDGGL